MFILLIKGWVPSFAAEAEPYVLLRNGNVLRGTAQVVGDTVVLQRGDGSELRLRSADVEYSAFDLQDVYRYRISRRDFRAPAMIADDAHWCLRQGLLDEADAELKKLEEADSSYPTLSRLKRQLSVARNPATTSPPSETVVSQTTDSESEASKKHEPPTANLSGVSAQSLVEFTTRVQPMLIKSCGANGCHRTAGDTQYQLSHFGMSTRVSARMTQLNLAATLAFASNDHPDQSEILKYATTPHGKDYKAADRPDLLTQQTLRNWLLTANSYPQPHRSGAETQLPSMAAVQNANAFSGTLPGGDVATASGTVPAPRAINRINSPASNGGMPGAGMPLPTPPHLPGANDLLPEGFTEDENGEWIYDPDGSFTGEQATSSTQSSNKPPQPALSSGIQTAPVNRPTGRPMRLPTVENPLSPDLFNRQNQLLAPTSGNK